MRLLYTGATLLLAAGLLTAGEAQGDWVKINPRDGKCEALFPASPQLQAKKGEKQYILERAGGKSGLMLQFNNMPVNVDITNADFSRLVLNGGRDGLLKAFQGAKVVSEKDFKYKNRYPARDLAVNIPTLGIYKVRIILTGRMLYQVTVLGPQSYQSGAEAKRFVESFKLLD